VQPRGGGADEDSPIIGQGNRRLDRCDELEGDPVSEVAELLDKGLGATGFLEYYVPQIDALPDHLVMSCSLSVMVVYLYGHIIRCDQGVPDEAGRMWKHEMRCGGPDPLPTVLDFPWLLANIMDSGWDSIAVSRMRVIFSLLAAMQKNWPRRTEPPGCGHAELIFANSLASMRLDAQTAQHAAAYLLNSSAGMADGPCSGHLLTAAWLVLGTRATPDAAPGEPQPLTPCSALTLAQKALKSYYRGAGMLQWQREQRPGTPLMESSVPLFFLLERAGQLCRQRPQMGNPTSSAFDYYAGLQEIAGGEDAKKTFGEKAQASLLVEAVEGELLLPFSPDFTAADRERFLRVHKAFHDLCRTLRIPYTLIRGPLLGVLRHHAPLPWENDGDVCVPREHHEEFLALALARSVQSPPELCLQLPRCSEVASAAASILIPRGVRLLSMLNARKNDAKLIFYSDEDAGRLLADRRGLHDPVIDVYLCGGWPEHDEQGEVAEVAGDALQSGPGDFAEAGDIYPRDWIFPLRRVFFAGLSLWAYRDHRGIINKRYGKTWAQQCRSPDLTTRDKLNSNRPWPREVPCRAIDSFHARAIAVEPTAVPRVERLGEKLQAWLCAAILASSKTMRRGGNAGREKVGSGFDGDVLADICPPTSRRDAGLEVEYADALLAPRRAVRASAPPVLHYLLGLILHPAAGLLCDVVVRLVPISASAPASDGVNFENLWFTMPPLHRRAVVSVTGGEPSIGSIAFLEVFACTCWAKPLSITSRPLWDLEDSDRPEHVAEVATVALARVAPKGQVE